MEGLMIPERFGHLDDPYHVEVSSKIALHGREFVRLMLWRKKASSGGGHETTGALRDVTVGPEQTDFEVETAVRAAAKELLQGEG